MWVFFVVVLSLANPSVELAREPWAYFETELECRTWQSWWAMHHHWLKEYGVQATACQWEEPVMLGESEK